MMKWLQLYEQISGIQWICDDLFFIDEVVMQCRVVIFIIVRELWVLVLNGVYLECGWVFYEWMQYLKVGDLVVEIVGMLYFIWFDVDGDVCVFICFGILLGCWIEWVCFDEEWQCYWEEGEVDGYLMFDESWIIIEVVYVQYGFLFDDICCWVNCLIIVLLIGFFYYMVDWQF